MNRREFITLLGGAAAAWPLAARAQQREQTRRMGMLFGLAPNDSVMLTRVAAFHQTLQQLGWAEGRNLRVDTRWSADNADDTRKYAAELVEVRRTSSLAPARLPRQHCSKRPALCQLCSLSSRTRSAVA